MSHMETEGPSSPQSRPITRTGGAPPPRRVREGRSHRGHSVSIQEDAPPQLAPDGHDSRARLFADDPAVRPADDPQSIPQIPIEQRQIAAAEVDRRLDMPEIEDDGGELIDSDRFYLCATEFPADDPVPAQAGAASDLQPARQVPLEQRSIAPAETRRGWLQTLNPFSWWSGSSEPARPAPSPQKTGILNYIKNQYISAWSDPGLFSYVNGFVTPWMEGITAPELMATLKAVSTTWNNQQNGQTQAPESIHLGRLHLPDTSVALQDVTLRLHDVRMESEGAPEGGLRLILNGDAEGTLQQEGETAPAGTEPLQIAGLQIELIFYEEALIRNLVETGALSSSLLNVGRKVLQPLSLLAMEGIRIQIGQLRLGEPVSPEPCDKPQSCVTLNNPTLDIAFVRRPGNPDTPEEPGLLETRLKVDNLDIEAEGDRLPSALPDNLRYQLEQLAPVTSEGSSQVRLKADTLNLSYYPGELELGIPALQLSSRGAIKVADGAISNLTLTQRERETGAAVPPSDLEVQLDRFDCQLQMEHQRDDLPWDIRGPVHLEKARVHMAYKPGTTAAADQTQVSCAVEQMTTALTGGVELQGRINQVEMLWDSRSEQRHTEARLIEIDHLALGDKPEAVTEDALQLAAKGQLQGLHLTQMSGEEGSHTQLNLRQLAAEDIKGYARAGKLDMQQLQMVHIVDPLLKTAAPSAAPVPFSGNQITSRIGQLNVEQLQLPVQEDSQLDMDQTRLSNMEIHCQLGTAPRSQEISLQPEGASVTRAGNQLLCTELKVQASELTADNPALVARNPDGSPPQPAPEGQLVCTAPALEIHHDADQGWEAIGLRAKEAGLALGREGSDGTISTRALQADIQRGTEQHPDQVTGTIAMDALEARALQLPSTLLPEGVTTRLDGTLSQITAGLTLPAPGSDAAAQDGAAGLDWTLQAQDTHTQARLQVAPGLIPALPTALADDNAQAGWQQTLLAPLLQQIQSAAQRQPHADQSRPLEQTLVLDTGVTRLDRQTGADSSCTDQLSTQEAHLAMTSGELTAEASLNDLKVQHRQAEAGSSTELRLDSAMVNKAHTNPASTLPVQLALPTPAMIHGLEIHSDTHTGKRHIGVDNAAVDIRAGLRIPGTVAEDSPEPAHLQARINNAHLHRNEAGQTMATVDAASLQMNQTAGQLGVAVDLHAEGENLLATATTQADRFTAQMEVGAAQLNVQGDINGNALAGGVGVTLQQDNEGIRINPHVENRHLTLDFPQLVRELVTLASERNQLEGSALGTLCDLELDPQLDSQLNGQISFAASGALSPFIAMALGWLSSPVKRQVFRLTRLLTRRLRFRLTLDRLDVREGMISTTDLINSLSLSVTSTRNKRRSRLYARLLEKLVNTSKRKMTRVAAKRLRALEDPDTPGRVSLSSLLQATRQHISLVTAQRMPGSPVVATGDALRDAHNHVRSGLAFPASWTSEQYERLLNARIDAMRWQGRPATDWSDPAERKALCSAIANGFPWPTTAEEFKQVEELLSQLQAQIRHCTETPCLETLYNRLHNG